MEPRMSFQEENLRLAIETQKSVGFKVTDQFWFTFRDGRTPPSVSPWGAILWKMNSTESGNFLIPPKGTWWNSVRDFLQVSDSWMDTFMLSFANQQVNKFMTPDELDAYSLAQDLRRDYLDLLC